MLFDLSILLNLPDNRTANSKLYSQLCQWTLSFLAAAKVNFNSKIPKISENLFKINFNTFLPFQLLNITVSGNQLSVESGCKEIPFIWTFQIFLNLFFNSDQTTYNQTLKELLPPFLHYCFLFSGCKDRSLFFISKHDTNLF